MQFGTHTQELIYLPTGRLAGWSIYVIWVY